MTTALVKYDAMCRAIDHAYQVDEVKDIRDKALAFEAYARQAHNIEAERQACDIRIRAEKKGGQLLRAMQKTKGRPRTAAPSAFQKAINAAGLSKDQAKRWQQLAGVPGRPMPRSRPASTIWPTSTAARNAMTRRSRFTSAPSKSWKRPSAPTTRTWRRCLPIWPGCTRRGATSSWPSRCSRAPWRYRMPPSGRTTRPRPKASRVWPSFCAGKGLGGLFGLRAGGAGGSGWRDPPG